MKKFILLLILLLMITTIMVYGVIQYRTNQIEANKHNQEYEVYHNTDLLGIDLISLINKIANENEKNDIPKDEEGYYIDNEKDSIILKVRFLYKDDYKEIPMEKIVETGTEAFIKPYSTATFRCTNIEYHEATNKVKSLTFEEIKK